jgi:gamma-glutamylcyclotransferase (GGCT)/AIG2-like uncharacterized protein YtfP
MISARSRKRDSLLFVYGTLRSFTATPMAKWLGANAVYCGVARTRGRLYALGTYPGMTPARRRGEWVIGEVYRLRAPLTLLRALDRYESRSSGRTRSAFVRTRLPVELTGGGTTPAWVYLYRLPTLARARVFEGDYDRSVSGGYS